MTYTCDYSYLPCQFCVGKNHCAQCGEDIRQTLLGLSGVMEVAMDIQNRRLTLTLDGADPDDIADQADAAGVFL